MRSHDDFQQRAVAAGEGGFQITIEQRGERFLGRSIRDARRERLQAVEREVELDGQRLLAPERAVVVERGDAFRYRHKVRRAWRRHFANEIHDGLFRLAVIPRGEGVSGASDGCNECQRTNKCGGEELELRRDVHSLKFFIVLWKVGRVHCDVS